MAFNRALISDEEIVELNDKGVFTKNESALEKWRFTQRMFELMKRSEREKDGANATKHKVLMGSPEYAAAYNALREAKADLDEAEKAALQDDEISRFYEQAEGIRILRIGEFKIFKRLFDMGARACKADKLQLDFSLFVEKEDEVGEYSRYDLYTEGGAAYDRGKCYGGPREHEKEILEQMANPGTGLSEDVSKFNDHNQKMVNSPTSGIDKISVSMNGGDEVVLAEREPTEP